MKFIVGYRAIGEVLLGSLLVALARYILKRVYDVTRGRELTLREMITFEYFETRKDLERYLVIDNTSEDIWDAMANMLETLEGSPEPAPEQLELRDLIAALNSSPELALRRVRKGDPAVQLLGDGLPGRAFAARYLGDVRDR